MLSDVVAAAAGLLASALIMATAQGRLQVDASVDLLGVVGTLLVVGGVALSFVIDLVTAERRITVLGLRVATPWWVAGVVCFGGIAYLLR